jgi:soluble lytic murein transglycosylase
MTSILRDPTVRRITMCAASLAVIGFVGGALVGPHRRAQDHQRWDAAPAEPSQQSREDGLPQEAKAEPERVGAPAAEPPRPDALGVDARPDASYDALRRAIELFRKGDMAGGDRAKAGLTDPVERSLSEWVAVRFGWVGFERIAAFMRENPDWPAMAALGRRAEEALLVARKPAAVVCAFFAEQPPTTAAGKVALALAHKSEGAEHEAAALVRDAWRNDTFGRELEAKILDLFPGLLTQVDHRDRMEHFLFRENWTSALRAAAYASKDYVLLAKARMAIRQEADDAQKALDAVPPSLRYETSYLFAKAQFLRRRDKLDEAVQVLADVSRDPDILADGDGWWVERRIVARELLDRGDALAAYAVARDHAAQSAEKRVDAEFYAGWIALRFLNHPATAARHFADAAKMAAKPISVARTAYWQGRTAETFGAHDDARRFYEKAAGYSVTYYGQLARAKLGLPEVQLRTVEAGGRSVFGPLPVTQAVKRLYEAGSRDIAFALCADLAASLTDAAHLDALGQLVTDTGDPRTLLTVGKTAVQRGFPLDLHAFPTLGLPAFEPIGERIEKAMVYAITRQESAFDPAAQSSAGARGLMQLMPDTAKRTAKRFGIEFDLGQLLDPAYNVKLGVAHLGELMDDWKGSHILMFASYNAGGGNVSKWIKAYGDPRSPNVDPIDWVERIPFSETRNYVQRVMENLLVYRSRLTERSASARPEEKAVLQLNPVP